MCSPSRSTDGSTASATAATPTLTDYNEAIYQAYLAGPGRPQTHPFYFDNCWDVMRTIDYLVSRDDVDADRIGLMGRARGGSKPT